MEAEELLKDVLAVTRDAGFNRVRYIGQLMSQEEQAEFLKGLFNQAVQAREAKSGEALFDYLEQWEEKGMTIVAGRAQSPIELDATPWTPLRLPIREAKVAIVVDWRTSTRFPKVSMCCHSRARASPMRRPVKARSR